MEYKEFFNQIKKGDFADIYVFEGPEEYVKDRALDALKAALVPPEMESLNFEYLQRENANTAQIVRSLETLPFMAQRRLVVVRDYPPFLAAGAGSSGDTTADQAALQRLLEHWPAHACLVFLMRQPPDERKSLYRLVAGQACVCAFKLLEETDAVAHISKMVRSRGCTITPATSQFLLRYTGGSLAQMDNEAAKLCALIGPGQAVEQAHITTLCAQSQEYRVYELTDALFGGQTAQALGLLRHMMQEGEEPSMLVAMLARQTRLLAAAAGDRKITAERLADAMEVKLYPARKALALGRRLGFDTLSQCMRLCAHADSAIKQGHYEGEAAVEELAMRMARLCSSVS